METRDFRRFQIFQLLYVCRPDVEAAAVSRPCHAIGGGFSDGICEASSRDQQFGDARIQQIVVDHHDETASAIVDRVMSGVRDFTRRIRQRDDMSVFVVNYLA